MLFSSLVRFESSSAAFNSSWLFFSSFVAWIFSSSWAFAAFCVAVYAAIPAATAATPAMIAPHGFAAIASPSALIPPVSNAIFAVVFAITAPALNTSIAVPTDASKVTISGICFGNHCASCNRLESTGPTIGSTTLTVKPRLMVSREEATVSYFTFLTSSIFPFTSVKSSPRVVKDFTTFRFASSPIVPNAVDAMVRASCSSLQFEISLTIESMTSFILPLPFCHALNAFSVVFDHIPVPSFSSPVFSSISAIVSPMVPSARRFFISLMESLTLSRLYAPPLVPFFSN